MKSHLILAILALLLSCSGCTESREISPEAKAVVAKYDERIAALDKNVKSIREADLGELLKIAGPKISEQSLVDIIKARFDGLASAKELEKEKWELELKKLEFILKERRGGQ